MAGPDEHRAKAAYRLSDSLRWTQRDRCGVGRRPSTKWWLLCLCDSFSLSEQRAELLAAFIRDGLLHSACAVSNGFQPRISDSDACEIVEVPVSTGALNE